MLDRRFGERRSNEFDATPEGMLVKKIYEYRCLCEGIVMIAAGPQIAESLQGAA
jgi:hypothetical protein